MSVLSRALLGTGTGFFSADWLVLRCLGDGPCSLETLTYICLSTSSILPSDCVFDLKKSKCVHNTPILCGTHSKSRPADLHTHTCTYTHTRKHTHTHTHLHSTLWFSLPLHNIIQLTSVQWMVVCH